MPQWLRACLLPVLLCEQDFLGRPTRRIPCDEFQVRIPYASSSVSQELRVAMLERKKSFLACLPTKAEIKSGKTIETLEERLEAVIGIIKKHCGEVVAVTGGSRSRKWDLWQTNKSPTKDTKLPDQFLLHQDGRTYQERKELELIHSLASFSEQSKPLHVLAVM